MKFVLDACVLYPSVLREILQAAGEEGLYQPLWSDRILGEWTRATVKLGPEAHAQAQREAAAFALAFPKGRVQAQPAIERSLVLPDPADLHVLAVAIAGGTEGIVTFNAADFPRHVLAAEGVQRRDPDGFLWELHSGSPEKMTAIIEAARTRAAAASGREVDLKWLLKRLRLYKLSKALLA